jgi:hypothetical protein
MGSRGENEDTYAVISNICIRIRIRIRIIQLSFLGDTVIITIRIHTVIKCSYYPLSTYKVRSWVFWALKL